MARRTITAGTVINCTFTNYIASVTAITNIGDNGKATVILNNCILSATEIDDVVEFSSHILNGGIAVSSGIGNLFLNSSPDFEGEVVKNADPLLGPLTDNGGPTFTHLPLAGSPAIDNGNNTAVSGRTTDQRRGTTVRIFNGKVDIGAVEVQPIIASAERT